MAAKKPRVPAAAGPATRGLKVVSRRPSFCRAGRQFTGEPTIIPLSELTEDEVDALKDEPMLVVQEVDIEPEDEATAS